MLVGFWWTSQFTTPWVGPKHGSINIFWWTKVSPRLLRCTNHFHQISIRGHLDASGYFSQHTITSRSSRSSRIPASWHTNSGHRASLATSKRCFNKGGAAYFLARDQYVQKISKSKTRQDKWSIQRRNQRSLDPWGKPVKPRAKMGQVLLTQLLLPANWIVFQTTPDSKIQWIQFPHMVCSFNGRDNPKRAKWLRMPGYFEWNS